MAYNYSIKPTNSALTANELYEGRSVCFSDIKTNPNNIGILEKVKSTIDGVGYWTSVINGIKYIFDRDGKRVLNGSSQGNAMLYGVLSEEAIDPTTSTAVTRSGGGSGKANTVSLTTMAPKDYFACHALNALIHCVTNPLSMDDGMIALLAAKSYKIAQAMATEAYGSRENDNASSEQSGASYVEVDEQTLQTNTERILYNINESIKANTKSNKDTGIKVSNIDKVKFDGTQTVAIEGTPNVNVSNSPTVAVSGTVPVSGTVSVNQPVTVNGTVSVDNFPTSE